jgi:hypothetical protein
MNPLTESSVREDESSVLYTYRRGWKAVTFTVLKVGSELIGCDLTTHAADPAGEMCGTLALPGVCLGNSLAAAKGFYTTLQRGEKTVRVEDDAVFAALAVYLTDEFGDYA